MTFSIITDTNGKLTIDINTQVDMIHIWFNDCIMFSCLLRKGKKGNVDINAHLTFIENFCLPTNLFTKEQLDYLKNFI